MPDEKVSSERNADTSMRLRKTVPRELTLARALVDRLDRRPGAPESVRIARALALSLVDQLESMLEELEAERPPIAV